MNSAIAAASFSRASPSTNQLRRRGAPMSRKTAITAAGSVVATIEPSRRQATRGTSANGHRANPIAAAVIRGRNYRKDQDGCSVLDRSFDVRGDSRLEDEQREKDVNKNRGVDGQFGKKARSQRRSGRESRIGVLIAGNAPMPIPIAASTTDCGSFSCAASCWLMPTTISRPAKNRSTSTVSNISSRAVVFDWRR